MTAFFRGAGYLLHGFGLLTQSGLKRFVVLPLLANIVLFAILFFTMRHYEGELSAWLVALLPWWLQWLDWILGIFFFTGFAIFFVYAFATAANLIACPFNSLLSEKVEYALTQKTSSERAWSQIVKDVPRVVGRQFGLIFYYLPRALGILILFFIPLVNVLAAPGWFLFNAWFMAMQYLDYPTDTHRLTFQETRAWMGRHRFQSWGFGLAVLVALMIPVVNFFAIPAAVAGATAFWVMESNGRD